MLAVPAEWQQLQQFIPRSHGLQTIPPKSFSVPPPTSNPRKRRFNQLSSSPTTTETLRRSSYEPSNFLPLQESPRKRQRLSPNHNHNHNHNRQSHQVSFIYTYIYICLYIQNNCIAIFFF